MTSVTQRTMASLQASYSSKLTAVIGPAIHAASESCEYDLKQVDQWAADYTYATIKPEVEIVFYSRGRRRTEDEQPPTLTGIQRVSSIKVLGTTVSINHLSMAGHVSALLDICVSTPFGLRVLRAHGLHQDCLDEVFRCMNPSLPRF